MNAMPHLSSFFHISGMNSDFSEFSVSSILAALQNKMDILPPFCFIANFWLCYSNMLVGLFIYLVIKKSPPGKL